MRRRQHLAHLAANLCGLEKEQAAATFKGGFGFHPLGVWCDNTTELLAVTLRPGNAGSNHAGDHIDVLTPSHRPGPGRSSAAALIRADGAGATHELLDWLTEQGQVRGRRSGVLGRLPDQEHRVDQRHHHDPRAGVDAGGHRRR